MNPEAFCSAKLVGALLGAGLEVKVLCSDKFIPPHFRIYDPSKMWEPVITVSSQVKVPVDLKKGYTLFLAVKYGAPYYTRWMHATVTRAVALHREAPADLIYSRSLPSWAHVAGYWAAKRAGLPWVANMNDPWDVHFSPTYPDLRHSGVARAVSLHWLRRTLRAASLITYPSVNLADFHRRISGVDHKYAVIPHVGHTLDSDASQESFHLVHAGILRLRDSRRSIKPLLLALRTFLDRTPQAEQETRLTLVGPEEEDTRKLLVDLRLASKVTGTGLIPYDESLRVISSAAVCVLVEANLKEGIYLPSKLADYLAAGKPVLALSPASGVVADLARDGPIIRVNPDDVEGIANALANLYAAYKNHLSGSIGLSDDVTKMFKASTVAARFIYEISVILHRG